MNSFLILMVSGFFGCCANPLPPPVPAVQAPFLNSKSLAFAHKTEKDKNPHNVPAEQMKQILRSLRLDGPGGSGGGNGQQVKLVQAQALLRKLLQKPDPTSLSDEERVGLLMDATQGQILIANQDLGALYVTGDAPGTDVIFQTGSLAEVATQLSLSQALDLLALVYGMHFSDPAAVTAKILQLIRNEIKVPEFLDWPVLRMQSLEADGCRREIRLMADGIDGSLEIAAVSAPGSCVSMTGLQMARDSQLERFRENPLIHYTCADDSGAISCQQIDLDMESNSNDYSECRLNGAPKVPPGKLRITADTTGDQPILRADVTYSRCEVNGGAPLISGTTIDYQYKALLSGLL